MVRGTDREKRTNQPKEREIMSTQNSKVEQLWGHMLMADIVSEETLLVATSGWGYNLDTLETVLYVKTGYRSLDQIEDMFKDIED